MTQTPTLRTYPKNVVSRTVQLGVAHDLARKIGYETRRGHVGREHYEARLQELIGRPSLKGASREERNCVVRAFEAELTAATTRRALPVVSDDEALDILGVAA